MAVKRKPYYPFGSATKRFGKFTFHPNLDKTGIYVSRPPASDPARYHPKSIAEAYAVNKKSSGGKDPWKSKVEVEEWSQNLGFRNPGVLAYRKYRQTIGGPAWTTPKELPKYEPACKNVGFGRTPRWKDRHSFHDNLPGPGLYYNASPYKAPYGPHSTRPTFDWGEACRFKETQTKWSLAPNRYDIVDKDDIENKPKKVVSLRGPYDLFTGKRDKSTIFNKLAETKSAASTWPLALPTMIKFYKNTPYGKFNKTGRDKPYRGRNSLVDSSLAIRNPNEPGPAHLNIDAPKVFKQYKYGFYSSYDKPPNYVRTVVWPAVGRYTIKDQRGEIPGSGHRHVFVSKVPRTIGAIIQKPLNAF